MGPLFSKIAELSPYVTFLSVLTLQKVINVDVASKREEFRKVSDYVVML